MDHEAAVELKATERYFLGELTGDDRDEFEEHFFICPDCAEDVRALTMLAANAKTVLREESAPPVVPSFMSTKALWLSGALNVALLSGLLYGLLGMAPNLKQQLAQARAPQFVQDVPVLGLSRGETAAREIASTTERIVFSFYLRDRFQNISYELKDAAGPDVPRKTLPAPPKEDSAESHFSISTAGLKPGSYQIKFWGNNASGETPIGQSTFKIAAP